MNSVKRIAYILVFGMVLVLLSLSFKGNEILQRAIVIGIGVDMDDDGDYIVTAEILSPGGGSDQQVGTFSKLVSGKGRTVETAVTEINGKTGNEASLGQCLLLVLGESFYRNADLHDCISYFAYSDSFKESATVCCCEGEASDLMQTGLPLSQSVSLALTQLLKGVGGEIGVAGVNLLDFTRSQLELSRAGYLNYIKIIPENLGGNKDSNQPDKKIGAFDCNQIAVFKKESFIGVLTDDESEGFSLITNKASGQLFVVTNDEPTETFPAYLTLRANSNAADISVSTEGGYSADINVKLKIKKSRTDTAGDGGTLSPKTPEELDGEILAETEKQAREYIETFISRQQKDNFDIIGVFEMFHADYGKEWHELSRTVHLKDIAFKVKVEVKES